MATLLKKPLAFMGEKLIEDKAVKDCSSEFAGTAQKTGRGGQNGALCLEFRAKGAVSVASGKSLTLKVKDSADGTSFSDRENWVYTDADNATTFDDGELIKDYVLPPSANEYVNVSVTCDDSAATGSIDVAIRYLAH